ADLAEHLEDLGRSLRSGVASWDDELRALVLETVGELRALLDAVDTWGAEEEERARRMHARWLPEGEDEARSATSREPEPVPISALFFDDEGPHIVQGPVRRAPHAATAEIPTMENGPVVPIQELLFRGHAALREAISLRPRFESLARGDALPGQELPDLVRELFDLVELGMTDDSRSE